MVFRDVGAFYGSYTALCSQLVGQSGEAWSIEPIPGTFRILSDCVSKAKPENVRLFNGHLVEACGIATMEIPRFKNRGETWYDPRLVETRSHLRNFQVQTAPFDSLLRTVIVRSGS